MALAHVAGCGGGAGDGDGDGSTGSEEPPGCIKPQPRASEVDYEAENKALRKQI